MLAILMKLKRGPKNLKRAYRLVKKKRPMVKVHKKYAEQLSELERELFGATSMPSNWMSVHSVNMETGMVVFHGDDITPTPSGPKKRSPTNSPSQRVAYINTAQLITDFSDSSDTEVLDTNGALHLSHMKEDATSRCNINTTLKPPARRLFTQISSGSDEAKQRSSSEELKQLNRYSGNISQSDIEFQIALCQSKPLIFRSDSIKLEKLVSQANFSPFRS